MPSLSRDAPQLLRELDRRDDPAAVADDRLKDQAGHAGQAGIGVVQALLDVGGAVQVAGGILAPVGTAVAVGVGIMVDLGEEGEKVLPVIVLGGQGQRAARLAVKAALHGDKTGLSGVEARRLVGAFDRFGAGVGNVRDGQIAGRDLGQLAQELHARAPGAGAVHQPPGLLADRGDDLGVGMAGAGDTRGRREVYIDVAIHVHDVRPPGGLLNGGHDAPLDVVRGGHLKAGHVGGQFPGSWAGRRYGYVSKHLPKLGVMRTWHQALLLSTRCAISVALFIAQG